MSFKTLNSFFRDLEKEDTKYLEKGKYYIIRVDGNNFSKLTEKHFAKPFDEKFQKHMLKCVKNVMLKYNFGIRFAYFQSDEASFLLENENNNIKTRKLISLIPSAMSVEFSMTVGQQVLFDARIITLDAPDDVIRYFVWRYLDSERNSLNTMAFYQLINKLGDKRQASRELERMNRDKKKELVVTNNPHILAMPYWITGGTLVYYTSEQKEGFNPITKEKTVVMRKSLISQDVVNKDRLVKFLDRRIRE